MGQKKTMGWLVRVTNSRRESKREAESYLAVKLEQGDGSEEFWVLFTEAEISALHRVELDVRCPVLKPGRLSMRHHRPGSDSWCSLLRLILQDQDGKVLEDATYSVTDVRLRRAVARAESNQEDIPRTGWFADLRD